MFVGGSDAGFCDTPDSTPAVPRSIGRIIGVAAAIIAAAIVAIALGVRNNSDQTSSVPAPLEVRAEARCVAAWNASDNGWRSQLAALGRSQTVYVAVGFSREYPDQCLVAMGVPGMFDQAWVQSGGTGSGGWVPTGLSNVPVWNATPHVDGTILLNS